MTDVDVQNVNVRNVDVQNVDVQNVDGWVLRVFDRAEFEP